MAEHKYEAFRGLLRSAICNRTQAQFAKESGISPEHLSRMLNRETIHRPNKNTLQKIACVAKNGITFQDLQDALDQGDGTTHHASKIREQQAQADFAPEFNEQAERTMEVIAGILDRQQFPFIIDSIPDYINRIVDEPCDRETHPDMLPVAYEIGKIRPNFGTYNKNAKFWAPVWLSMSDGIEVAESELMLHFDKLDCKDGRARYVIHGATCKAEAFEDQYGCSEIAMQRAKAMLDGEIPYPEGLSRPVMASDENGETPEPDEEVLCMTLANAMPYTLNFTPAVQFKEQYNPGGNTPEEQLLKSIFGEPARWSETLDGFGFWLDTPPEKLHQFLADHKSKALAAYEPDGSNDEPGKYGELKNILENQASTPEEIASALNQFEYQDPDMNDDQGWQSTVAEIMRAETGFPFAYHAKAKNTDEFPGLSPQSCIMIENRNMGDIQREALLHAVSRYARLLGIKKFGDLLFTHVHVDLRKPMTYVLKDNPGVKNDTAGDTAGHDDSKYVEFEKNNPDKMPAATGRYMVELKDGRIVDLVWLDGQNLWIRARKEWSHMVARFCPDIIHDGDDGQSKDGTGSTIAVTDT